MKRQLIEPRILKGFRDYLPREMIHRRRMIALLEEVFVTFGYVPIDTPALELSEILLGKGSQETDKQLYRFLDNGERDVALRFDLTVPLARFVATHKQELGMPFRRYHIAPVWRAEKPQRGRYREFIQCDFDIIGTRSPYADAEIVAVIHAAMKTLRVRHLIRINNRSILNGFLETLGIKGQGASVLRALDKLDKVGKDGVARELQSEAGLRPEDVERVWSFTALQERAENSEEVLRGLRELVGGNETGNRGVNELSAVLESLSALGLPAESYGIDLSIARGLDYYTGTVFETTCLDLPQIGSICSGGRYDDLAGLYTSDDLPGVGASVGLDRLIAALEELGRLEGSASTARVLVTMIDAGTEAACLRLAQQLRAAGIPTELYPEVKKLASQLKYADRKEIPCAVILGSRELEREVCGIKLLKTGEQREVALADMPRIVGELLASAAS